MITENDLQEAIAECVGQRNPSSSTCLKLAAYYTIKDKMYPEEPQAQLLPGYSMASSSIETADYNSETEFGRLVSGMRVDEIMPVVDELMSTLQVISPRLYAGVIRKLSDL